MGCASEPSNTQLKNPIAATDDSQGLQALLMLDDGLSNILELHIECKNLRNLDTFNKSDPMVVAYTLNRNHTLSEIGRTEIIKENLNPKFIKSIIYKYYFQERQIVIN